jgi:cytochrome c5
MKTLWVSLVFIAQAYSASHHPVDFIEKVKNKPHEAEKIYQAFCKNCHAPNPLIPVGAPRIGKADDWQGRKLLLEHTIAGKGIMPARGGCFECSDEQLQKAIEYMTDFKNIK